MKTLNQLIDDYTQHVQQGEIQIAYKSIFDFFGKLRVEMIKKYPLYEIGSIYQGYMDMTYFSLSTKRLKDKGLKFAIVYLHASRTFEVWFSARNREVAKNYGSLLINSIPDDITTFHDDHNQDAIIECTLTSAPNFENQALLQDVIEHGVIKFVAAIDKLL